MQTTSTLFFTFAFLLFSTAVSAQYQYYNGSGQYHKNIYVEFRGSHLGAGINFDMRLKPGQLNGIGFRAGIGGISATGRSGGDSYRLGIVTFPLEFNHIVSRKQGGLIAGVGLLPVYASISGSGEATNHQYIRTEGFDLVGGFMTFGYRHQPYRNGFMFQINWNPMILRGSGFQSGWFSIGFGVGFK